MKRRCRFKNKFGGPCEAAPVRGKSFCVLHEPGRARQLGSIGGRSRRSHRLDQLPTPKTAKLLVDVLSATMTDVRLDASRMDARTASALASLGNALHGVIKSSLLEDRMDALEKRQDQQDRRLSERPNQQA
jgi:hypothetical protein